MFQRSKKKKKHITSLSELNIYLILWYFQSFVWLGLLMTQRRKGLNVLDPQWQWLAYERPHSARQTPEIDMVQDKTLLHVHPVSMAVSHFRILPNTALYMQSCLLGWSALPCPLGSGGNCFGLFKSVFATTCGPACSFDPKFGHFNGPSSGAWTFSRSVLQQAVLRRSLPSSFTCWTFPLHA